MAGVFLPAVLLPPVAADVVAFPVFGDMPVILDAANLVVPATPCLDWQPMLAAGGAAVQAFVPHWRTLRAFLRGDALSELTHFVSLLPVLLLDFF